ncbi:MAG: MaoC family dehydratase N-terminal domain-containing protein [Gammaproteobacteria bacterium]|nr:MaoC family dehydratase N-terminal domain-containing protein [Gammaproteobacteria bacterium]
MSDLLDIEAVREQFLNQVFDEQTFELDTAQIVDYARACGEQAPRYVDPGHPDFQAPPTFPSSFRPTRRLPEGFPKLPGLGMDAGKAVAPMAPVRPGVKLTARTHLHEVYAKTGRSGRMTFMVTRMEIFDPDGVQLAAADTRIVIREKPSS